MSAYVSSGVSPSLLTGSWFAGFKDMWRAGHRGNHLAGAGYGHSVRARRVTGRSIASKASVSWPNGCDVAEVAVGYGLDRKSTRLNSSHI